MNKDSVLKLEEILKEYIREEGVPGMAVGIVKGKETLLRSFGVRSIASKEKVNQNTIFHMASVSKTMLATAMMCLVEKGKIQLDSSIGEVLPYFTIADGKEREITIRRALSHTSGLTYTDDSEWEKEISDEGALERYVRSLGHVERLLEPDQQFYYNNTLYDVLGDVISKVYGASFEKAVEELVLQPLKMHRSTFLKSDISDDNAASPHVMTTKNNVGVTVSDVYPYNRMHAPCSSLHSCTEDLVRFIRFYTEGEEEFIKRKTINKFLQPVQQISEEPPTYMGLGWFLSEYKGEPIHYHSGGDTGFNTKLIILPGKRAGAVFMCNADYVDVDQLTSLMLAFLSDEPLSPMIPSYRGRVIRAVREKNASDLKESMSVLMSRREEVSIKKDISRLMNLLIEEKEFDSAQSILTQAQIRFPGDPLILTLEAQLLASSGQKEVARNKFRELLIVSPGNYDAYRESNKESS